MIIDPVTLPLTLQLQMLKNEGICIGGTIVDENQILKLLPTGICVLKK
jgi:hypothetical protein